MSNPDPVAPLVALGFSQLEAEVYVCLCREAPATGYRVAQAIGKAVANTYKAIESLREKGAIIVDNGETRLLRAVPYAELLDRFEQRFRDTRERAAAALAALAPPPPDDRVYTLTTAEQVLERARHMLAEARQVVLGSIDPAPLAALAPDLTRATCRAEVTLKIYAPGAIEGAEIVLSNMPALGAELERLGTADVQAIGDELHLCVDGRQYLFALLGRDGGVVQAVWSQSLFLSLQSYNALSTELALTGLVRLVLRGGSPVEMRRLIQRMHHPFETVGYRDIVRRAAPPAQASLSENRRTRRGGRHAARD